MGGTLIRKIDGTPFLVSSVERQGGDVVCVGSTLPNEDFEIVPLRDVDLTPVPLGFCNIGTKMVFACRKPMRRDYKQGLSRQNLVTYGAEGTVGFKNLTDTILNIYPKVDEVVKYLSPKSSGSRAFSRDFGLSKKDGLINLCYRKYVVGKVEDKVLVLNRDKYFLEQHLSESVRA